MANRILSLTILLINYNSCFSSVNAGGETAVSSKDDVEEWSISLQNDTEYCYEDEYCHTTDGPPTIGPPGPSAAAMDGPPGPCTAATLGPGGPSTAVSITTVGPP